MEHYKYIITKKFGVITLVRGGDGFWRDPNGTIFALNDGRSIDDAKRCGIWPFALPTWDFFTPLNQACAPHDFAYSSPVYQAFHTRLEADEYLGNLQSIAANPIVAGIFEGISRLLGVEFWENDKTNN